MALASDLGVPFRRLLELGDRHPGDFGGPLRGKFIDHLLQGREILRPRLDKGLVMPAVLIDDVHEAVDQGHVGSQAVLYMQMGQGGDLGPPGIDHDELGPIGPGPHQAHGGNGVGHRSVRADGEDTIGVFQFGKGVGHCPTAEGGGQPGHRGRVSETGAVIDVVVAEHGPGKFLEDIGFFVGAAGRPHKSDALRAILVLETR